MKKWARSQWGGKISRFFFSSPDPCDIFQSHEVFREVGGLCEFGSNKQNLEFSGHLVKTRRSTESRQGFTKCTFSLVFQIYMGEKLVERRVGREKGEWVVQEEVGPSWQESVWPRQMGFVRVG